MYTDGGHINVFVIIKTDGTESLPSLHKYRSCSPYKIIEVKFRQVEKITHHKYVLCYFVINSMIQI